MKYIILLLLFISPKTKAQDMFSNQNIVAYSLSFTSGAADGINDANFFHHAFRGSHYWDFWESWKNKYKNGDPTQGEAFLGSTTVFVAFTDSYHMLGLVRDVTQAGAVALSFSDFSDLKHKWKYVLLKTFICYGSNRLGHLVTYDIIFKQK